VHFELLTPLSQVNQVVPIGKGKDSNGYRVIFSNDEERIYKGVVIAIG